MKILFTLSTLLVMSLSIEAQKWLDTTLYPFENKYIQLNAGKMHYVDEGKGDIILFIHGTPTWSFLYRQQIAELSKNYRCIAIDHIGFGLSEKPKNYDGTPESHAKNLNEFIEHLGLTSITIVVHDFGGPIGLASAIQNHNKIKQIVLLNTWLWETESNSEAQKVDKIINSKLGKFLYLKMNFSPNFLLKKGFYDKRKLSKKIHKQYIKPFPTPFSRISLLNIGKSLVGSSDWYQEQWGQLNQLDSKPWLILWGTQDKFITTKYLEKWCERLPNSRIKKFDYGHFLQEEVPEEITQEINDFMKK